MNETRSQYFVNQFAARYLRYVAAAAALRPIAEGLALFAEYDCYPDREGTQSLAMLVAKVLGTAFYEGALGDDYLRKKLEVARLAKLEKKSSLLAMPFDTRDGGYLLGYSVVRHYWRRAALYDPYFVEPDHFLTYCLGVVYGDFRQIENILDLSDGATVYPALYAERIGQSVVSALDEFFDQPSLPDRRRQVAELATREALSVGALNIPGMSRASIDVDMVDTMGLSSRRDVRTGNALLQKWFRHQNESESEMKGLPGGMTNVQNGMLLGRHVIRLISFEVEWTLSGDRVFIKGGLFDVASAVEAGEFSAKSGKGHVEVVLSSVDLFYAPILITDTEVVLLSSYARGVKPERLRSIFPFMNALGHDLDRDRELREWFEETLNAVLPADTQQKVHSTIGAVVTRVYASCVVGELAPSHERAFIEKTRAEGVLGLLDDPDLTRALAFISIRASARSSAQDVQDSLEAMTQKTGLFEKINNRYRAVCGVGVVQIDKNCIECFF